MSTSEAPSQTIATRRPWPRRALVVLLVFLASIPGAEAAYRWAGVQVAGAMGGFYESFGERSFKSAPGASVLMNWYSGTFHVHTDGLGFRVAQPGRPSPDPASIDILLMGDSQTFGQGLEYERTVAGEFAAIAGGHELRVANAAVGGHFLRNQLELLRWLVDGPRLRPRVIAVVLTPRSVSDPDGYSEAHVEEGQLWDAPPDFAKRARAWLSGNSAVYLTVRNAVRNATGGQSREATPYLRMYDAARFEGEAGAALASVVKDFADLAESIGARLVVAYLPLELDGVIDSVAAAQVPPAAGISGGAPGRAARAAAESAGVPFLDASCVLDNRRRDEKPITLKSDAHYNAGTSREVAELMYGSLDWPALTGRTGKSSAAPELGPAEGARNGD